ncbi:MAG: hypothetical protein C0622_04445 [Desulfuromonas sp.]|nr:MAG: hypothetical protein C0622_04445 [Desulfuromonas sp.]
MSETRLTGWSGDRLRSGVFIAALVLFVLLIGALPAVAEDVSFVAPGEGIEATTSKPEVACLFTFPVFRDRLLVQLDGIDITGALDLSGNGFTYKPILPLANGPHQLALAFYLPDGSVAQRSFFFSTFTRMSSTTQVSAVYEAEVAKSDHLTGIPKHNFAANIGHATTVTTGDWQLGLTTNLRWLDRSEPIVDPEKKGLDLVNYQLTAQYQKEAFGLLLAAGDVQIQETRNTVSGLARRGVQAGVVYDKLTLSGFVVNSEQLYGVDDGSGLEFDSGNTISGGSIGYRFFEDKLTLRAIYVTGSEESNSFGVYEEKTGEREGDVVGVQAQVQLFAGKLNIEAEYDWSDFDVDSGDGAGSVTDKAWMVTAGGYVDGYSYQASYDYIGPDYAVVGNPGLLNDREGFMAMGGMQKGVHGLNLSTSRYEDNVDEDPLLTKTVTTTITADYAYNGMPNLPLGLNYQKTIMDSTMLPEGAFPYRTDIDLFGARASYLLGSWNFSVNATYSLQDDKTSTDSDTRNQTYTFTPMYYSQAFSVVPSLIFNRTTDENRSVDTDTLTASLDLRGTLKEGKVTYELAGSFNRMTMSDDSMELETLTANAQLAYHFQQEWASFLNPSLGLRGQYNRTDDKLSGEDEDEYALFLVLSTSMNFAF